MIYYIHRHIGVWIVSIVHGVLVMSFFAGFILTILKETKSNNGLIPQKPWIYVLIIHIFPKFSINHPKPSSFSDFWFRASKDKRIQLHACKSFQVNSNLPSTLPYNFHVWVLKTEHAWSNLQSLQHQQQDWVKIFKPKGTVESADTVMYKNYDQPLFCNRPSSEGLI